ncbi:MAG: fasciclin domain-containing protein [Pseudomonadota bacterium]
MTLTGKFFTAILMSCSLFAATVVSAAHHEGAAMAKPEPTVVEIAAGNPDFSTLVAAVQAADLVDALSAEGPFTVFAPTNEAFAALPEGTVDMLLLPENKDKLVAILTYHVVPGKVMAAEVVEMTEATTLEGDTIAIAVTDEGVTVDGANVIATDIVGSNGVIHVIDAVIMPGS